MSGYQFPAQETDQLYVGTPLAALLFTVVAVIICLAGQRTRERPHRRVVILPLAAGVKHLPFECQRLSTNACRRDEASHPSAGM
jgi:hypothetical protein